MNFQHLKTILWLRWRLNINQWRKMGKINLIITLIFVSCILFFSAASLFLSIWIGASLLSEATPMSVLMMWDVMVGVLLFSWTIALMSDIQRMEMLSLEKLLHLPMSLREVFLLNYLSSLFSLNLAWFLPTAIGLSVALTYCHGFKMMLMLPLIASFVWMLTAVTYQFRGWLASLMANKRRQRNVLMFVTFGLVGISQLPNVVLQLALPAANKARHEQATEERTQTQQVRDMLDNGKITATEGTRRIEELQLSFRLKREYLEKANQETTERYLSMANLFLPIGWLPYSSKSLLGGSIWLSLLCFLGMTLIGTGSFWRSYKSTLDAYTGNTKTTTPKRSIAGDNARSREALRPIKSLLIERTIPKLSEHSTAIALSSFLNLLRAPESKMMLVGPIVAGIVFFVMFVSNESNNIPSGFAPFLWFGAISTLTFMSMVLLMNIFGMDRNGFRCFVLMPIERREILLGKNASILPFYCGVALFAAIGLSYIAPVGLLTVLANACQLMIAIMFAWMLGNWVSIQLPQSMVPGAGRPVQINFKTVLVQIVVMFLSPFVVMPGLIFLGAEWMLGYFYAINFVPVFLLLSILELVIVYRIYLHVIQQQGQLLQMRETIILEALTLNSE